MWICNNNKIKFRGKNTFLILLKLLNFGPKRVPYVRVSNYSVECDEDHIATLYIMYNIVYYTVCIIHTHIHW